METIFPELETERTRLRQFTDDDLHDVFAGLSHPEVIKYYGVSFDSAESTKEQLKWFRDLEENETGIWWAVCAKSDGAFLGAGGLCEMSKEHRKAEIGFWLLPDYWGRGLMTEVMPAILEYSFGTLDLHRIEGFVESENKNCKRAMSKLNFNLEGTMIDSEIKDGKFISVDIYSKINRR